MICFAISRKAGEKYLRYLEELAKSDVVLQPSFLLPELLSDAEHSTYKGQLPVPFSFYLNELTKCFVVIHLAKISSVYSGRAGPNTQLYLEWLARNILLPGRADQKYPGIPGRAGQKYSTIPGRADQKYYAIPKVCFAVPGRAGQKYSAIFGIFCCFQKGWPKVLFCTWKGWPKILFYTWRGWPKVCCCTWKGWPKIILLYLERLAKKYSTRLGRAGQKYSTVPGRAGQMFTTIPERAGQMYTTIAGRDGQKIFCYTWKGWPCYTWKGWPKVMLYSSEAFCIQAC